MLTDEGASLRAGEEDYRSIILERLKARDRECAQFARVFASYNALHESLNHLISKQNRLIGVRRRASTICGDSSSPPLPGADESTQLEVLRDELSDVYRKKAINDQQLIDANRRIATLEKELARLSDERDKALRRVEEVRMAMAECERRERETQQTNELLNDELLAMHAVYNAVNEKYLKADAERTELITRMKEVKEHEISLLNAQNDQEAQRQADRLRSALEEASRPNALDTRAMELLGLGGGGEGGSGAGQQVEYYGDIVPDSCRIRFECNELGEVNDCLFHPNGRTFFTAGADKKVKMWEMGHDSCTKKAAFTGANHAVTRLDIDSECKHLLAASNDFAVRLWSIEDQRHRLTFTGHSDRVSSARFLQQGRMVASGSADRTLKLWDIGTSRCVKTFFPASTVFDLATSERCGVPLISAHFDKTVRFWDTRCETPAKTIKLDGKVTSLFLSPADGQSLLCSSRDETLSLVDVRTYEIVHSYSAEQYRTSSDFAKCVISPGGRFIAAGSADGHIFIWNLTSTRLEKILFRGGHENSAVLSLSWHPSGHIIVSGDRRKMLCLWK